MACLFTYLTELLHVFLIERVPEEEDEAFAIVRRGVCRGHVPLDHFGNRQPGHFVVWKRLVAVPLVKPIIQTDTVRKEIPCID